jgi:hypothetical protein
MDDAFAFVLIIVIILLTFLNFYFVSYKNDEFILAQLQRQSQRITELENAINQTPQEPEPVE